MGPLLALGPLLLAVVAVAVRLLVHAVAALDVAPATARSEPRALQSSVSVSFEALREAARAGTPRDREAWLAEAEGVLRGVLCVPVAELRACTKIATAASFCAAAWSIRTALATSAHDTPGGVEESLARALSCVGLGLVATAALARLHRVGARAIREDREAFQALVAAVDAKEIRVVASESRDGVASCCTL